VIPGWLQTPEPPASSFSSAWITGVRHPIQLHFGTISFLRTTPVLHEAKKKTQGIHSPTSLWVGS
jgi:hypothetical protein